MNKDRFAKSQELFNRARKSMPGGVNSGIRLLETPVPLYHTHGKGARLWDVDDNEYIDYQIGQGALILGHAHPAIAEALSSQAYLGTHWAAQSELEISVAETLQRHIPVCEQVRFSNSATEIIIAVTRLARAATGRWKLLRFEGHYHGWNDEGLFGFAPDPAQWKEGEPSQPTHPSAGIVPDLAQYHLPAQWNDLESVERHFAENKDEIAAIICEPLMCNSGCIQPDPEFLSGLREICDRHKSLLVFDETITGFRFGMSGAEGWSGVQPDIMIMGKAIGGGVPFAALGARKPLMEMIEQGKVIHAGTLNGNPICLAAANACLKILENDTGYPDRLRSLGRKLMQGLDDLGSKYGIPLKTSGPGAAFQVVITEGPLPKNHREYVRSHDKPRWNKLRELLLLQGVRTTCRGLCFVSCAHTEADIDETLALADKAFANAKE